jgi:hypothetical protein
MRNTGLTTDLFLAANISANLYLAINPAMNLEWLEMLTGWPPEWWGASGLSQNSSLQKSWLERYPNMSWDWPVLSQNPGFTLDCREIICKDDNSQYAFNPNLGPEWFEEIPHLEDEISWLGVSNNDFHWGRHPTMSPELCADIERGATEMRYRPGATGYREALSDFQARVVV